MKSKIKKSFLIILKLLVTVASCFYLIQKFGPQFKAVDFSLSRINLFYVLLAFGAFLLSQFLAVFRWRQCCKALGVEQNWLNSIKQYFAGLFSNNFLPGSVGGDLVRAYLLKKNFPQQGYGNCVASVIIDRAYGLFSLSLIGLLVVVFFYPVSVNLKISFFVLALACFFGIFSAGFLKHIPLPIFIPCNVRIKLASFLGCLSLVQRDLQTVLHLVWTSFSIQLCVTACLWSLASAAHLDFQQSFLWLINPLATWGALVAPSINGLGVREGIFAHAAEMFGNKGSDGILLSLFWIGLVLFTSLPGAFFLMNGRAHVADLSGLEVSIELEEEKELASYK